MVHREGAGGRPLAGYCEDADGPEGGSLGAAVPGTDAEIGFKR